jgi:hypothetical protein
VSCANHLRLAAAVICGTLISVSCSPPPPIPDAQVLNLDSANRAPGSFFVTFRKSNELANIPRAILNSLTVLPGVLPTDDESVTKLAEAMAAQVGGSVDGIGFPPNPAFGLKDVKDDSRIRELAKDPRIGSIGANIMLSPMK